MPNCCAKSAHPVGAVVGDAVGVCDGGDVGLVVGW